MNQILYTENKKKNKGPLEMSTILRIFAILCIIFGAFLIIQATFAMLNGKEEKQKTVPVVTIDQETNTLKVNIKHDKIIDKIIYSWNENQEIVLQGKGRAEIEETINMPVGVNTLTLKITDIEGKTVTYTKEYELPEGDVTKPEIELLLDGSKVKIVAKDETELDYMLYYWNEEDETRVEVREDSLKQIEEKIEILKGENTLTIIAVDKAGNETIKEQTYKGAKKPKIELSRDGNVLIIKVTDEEGLQKIEYTLNGQEYSTDPEGTGTPLNMKELEIRQTLAEGENKITIKAYNINNLETEVSGEATI